MPIEGKKALHQMMQPGTTESPLKQKISVPHFAWYLMEVLFVFPLEIMQESTAKHALHLHAI